MALEASMTTQRIGGNGAGKMKNGKQLGNGEDRGNQVWKGTVLVTTALLISRLTSGS